MLSFPVPTPYKNGRPRGVSILGSTGSIGTQTLDIIRLFPRDFKINALAAGKNAALLIEQALEFRPELVVIEDRNGWKTVADRLRPEGIRVVQGKEGLLEAATFPDVETVVAAMVGFRGLSSVLEGIKAGKRVAVANKETLVVAGALVKDHLDRYEGSVIPVDSEHSAIFQCLVGESCRTIEKLILTASGGPFRSRPMETFARITRDEALQHPNWSMGAKITVDSATMMNKGLEVIEAHWLFGIEADRIDVLVHPQSIIHSMVTFQDGSTKAQLGLPDMRLPIQYALSFPDRWQAPHERIDWFKLRTLTFEPPDVQKFPCLPLAYRALELGGTAPAILNAANETAVALFLEDKISFMDISCLVKSAMEHLPIVSSPVLDDILEADATTRRYVQELKRTAADSRLI